MAWLAENIQSVFFLPPAGTFPDAAQVFEKVAGCAPDAYQRPVGGGPLSPSNAHGVIDGHAFTVSAQAGRIDVVLFGQPGESGPPQEITNVSAAIVVAQRIWVGLLDWLQVNRVSFVLNLIQLAANDEEVKALLEEAIPQVPLVGEPVDFSYSCNVRRQFDVDAAVTMNRLTRWGAARQQNVIYQPAPGGSVAMGGPIFVEDRTLATLLVDLNTAPVSQQAFPPQLARGLFTELAQEAEAILSGGHHALLSK